jgi:hypothetical protein
MAKSEKAKMKVVGDKGPAGFAMFVAFIGAFVYFAQGAHNFLDYVNAFFVALVWPGVVVFHVLQTLHA